MKPSEVLRAARDLLSAPDKWCRDGIATDSIGWPVHPSSERAVMWNVGGAISRMAVMASYHRTSMRAAHFFRLAIQCNDIADWELSPPRTYGDVIVAFNRAIEIAEAAGE